MLKYPTVNVFYKKLVENEKVTVFLVTKSNLIRKFIQISEIFEKTQSFNSVCR